jgi:hypothetical protein
MVLAKIAELFGKNSTVILAKKEDIVLLNN